MAISKAAFDVLVEHAAYTQKHYGIQAISEITHLCDGRVLNDAVNCLRSGSPSQILFAALTCSLFALHSLPDRQRLDFVPPTENLGFACLRHCRLCDVISRVQKNAEQALLSKGRWSYIRSTSALMGAAEELNRRFPNYKDIKLVRITANQENVSQEQPHEVSTCARCLRLSRSTQAAYQAREAPLVEFSASGFALVESWNSKFRAHGTHDICLFVTNECKEVDDRKTLAGLAEGLLQSGHICHTIWHPLPKEFHNRHSTINVFWRDTIWNLPLPLRPPINEQKADILNWIAELRGESLPTPKQSGELVYNWNRLQMSLHFLKEGLSWEEASQKVDQLLQSAPINSPEHRGLFDSPSHRNQIYKKLDHEESQKRKSPNEDNMRDRLA